jgi:hypothetical protein
MRIRWICFWTFVGLTVSFDALMAHFALQNNHDVYNWINLDVLPGVIMLSVIPIALFACYCKWPMKTWYAFVALFFASIILLGLMAQAEAGSVMPFASMMLVPFTVGGLVFLLVSHLIARKL